jgi:hypothetical protein
VGRRAPLADENEPGQPKIRLPRLIFQQFLPFSLLKLRSHLSAGLRDSIQENKLVYHLIDQYTK